MAAAPEMPSSHDGDPAGRVVVVPAVKYEGAVRREPAVANGRAQVGS